MWKSLMFTPSTCSYEGGSLSFSEGRAGGGRSTAKPSLFQGFKYSYKN